MSRAAIVNGTTTLHDDGDFDAFMGSPERYRHAREVLQRNVGSEVVLTTVTKSGCLRLSGTAAAIWRGLSEVRTLGELIALLATRYEVSRPRIASEVASLVNELAEGGLLERFGDDL